MSDPCPPAAPSKPEASLLTRLPAVLLAEILARLEAKDKFGFARTCWLVRRALKALPVFGLPVSLVASCRLAGRVYTLTFDDGARARLGANGEVLEGDLLARFRTHCVVIFTRDHPFLLAWTRARRASKKVLELARREALESAS